MDLEKVKQMARELTLFLADGPDLGEIHRDSNLNTLLNKVDDLLEELLIDDFDP